MKHTKTWEETWGKIDFFEATYKDIDKMVADGADANYTNVMATGDDDGLIAFSQYPLELAALSDNIEAFDALRKHGAIPKRIFFVYENGKIEYKSFLQDVIENNGRLVPHIVKYAQIPLTAEDLITAVRSHSRHMKVLLDHFDLKSHPKVAMRLLKETKKECNDEAQSLIVNAIKKKATKVQNLKSAKINSGR